MLQHNIVVCRDAPWQQPTHQRGRSADNPAVVRSATDGIAPQGNTPLVAKVEASKVGAPAASRPSGEVGYNPLIAWSWPFAFFPYTLPDATTTAVHGAARGTRAQHGAPIRTASELEGALERELPAALASGVKAVFGHEGVLGSRGVLSAYGAIGRHLHNPTYWMNSFGSWRGFAEVLTAFGGPMSNFGALGDFGPRSEFAQRFLRPLLGQLGQDLAKGGRYAVLGDSGPLSAIAALGALGPNGGTGYVLDPSGNFKDAQGDVVRTTQVRYQGQTQRHDLYELYTENKASRMTSNDGSWMVRGQLDHRDSDGDRFHFKVKAGQHLTVLATPERRGERYAVELLDKRGKLLARSDSTQLVNWTHLPFEKDTELSVRVRRLPDQQAFEPLTQAIDTLLFPLVATGEFFAPLAEAQGQRVDRLEPDRYRLYVTAG